MKKLTANDPETRSEDLLADNIARLKAMFPELITEGADGAAINLDVLKALVGDKTVSDAEEKYGLNWHGKRRSRQMALSPSTGTLRPCVEDSVDWESTQNLMIEGDNLEVLKLLQKSYAGKVKLIYIDPPYNTGKDFVYPDNFQDNVKNYLELTGQIEGGKKLSSNTEAGGRFHTDWMNMMYPRLKLARNLLSKDGVIFVSIDNGEEANLRKICDEVFGEENFVEILVWRKRQTQANLSKHIAPVHEFIFAYARDREGLSINRLEYPPEFIEKTFSNPDEDPRGPYQTRPLAQPQTSSNPEYAITLPNGRTLTAKWSCSTQTFQRYLEENRLYIPRDGEGMPRLKVFLSEAEGLLPNTWLSDIASMEEGSRELSQLFPDSSPFDFPKPSALIAHLLKLGSTENSLILDFFAGSGSTGDAVFNLNRKDRGHRRFILVQLPEPTKSKDYPTIAEITKERLRRAGQKLRAEYPDDRGDLGFRVFKLDSSNISEWMPDRNDLPKTLLESIEHLKTDRTETDILYELLLKLGFDLCLPIEKRSIAGKDVHAIGGGALLTCLAEKVTGEDVEPLAQGIIAWHNELAPAGDTTCVVRDGAFEDDVAKTNFTAILQQHGLTNVRSL